MKQTRKKWQSILWIEAAGFSAIILLSWISELAHVPHLIFDQPFTPNWQRAALRTIVMLAVWAWVHVATRKLLKRLHHLEEFVRICSWCRRVCHHDEWLTMEKFFSSKFDTKTTHGMCPDCLKRKYDEIATAAAAKQDTNVSA